eukprot:4704126-Pyramimonas_sp.AAC.1
MSTDIRHYVVDYVEYLQGQKANTYAIRMQTSENETMIFRHCCPSGSAQRLGSSAKIKTPLCLRTNDDATQEKIDAVLKDSAAVRSYVQRKRKQLIDELRGFRIKSESDTL